MITIEEGRKAYNQSRSGFALERYRMKDHEAAVEEFFALKMLESPIRTAQVFAAYPVLTERQLEDRRERELFAFGPGGDGMGDGLGDGMHDDGTPMMADLTAIASLRVYEREGEQAELAELRGEPV